MTDKKNFYNTAKPSNMPTKEEKKQERISLVDQKNLSFELEEGFRYRIVNDEFGRVAAFKKAGWVPVQDNNDISRNTADKATPLGSVVTKVVNQGTDARAHQGILMKIPLEYYQEDQRAKDRKSDQLESRVDPNKVNQTGADYGNTTKFDRNDRI